MTQYEKNRKLAEWIGWKWNAECPWHADEREWLLKHVDGCWSYTENGKPVHGRHVLDFYTDEAASALLLDKLLKVLPYKQILLDAETCFTDQPRKLNECEQDHEACIFLHLHIYIHADRKTAIAEACLTLIEKEG